MEDYKESIKNKYRPKKFGEMLGCETNRKSFVSILKTTDSESFILEGPRGTGKTTFSKLMADAIVKKYDASKAAIKEINVSNETGVDFARAIIEECSYSPFHKCSVYILNEIQMASTSYQNAMLDILEKPPKNTFFILCTTQAEKLDKAVLSRCTKFKFNPLSKEKMLEFIDSISEQEEITLTSSQKDDIFESSFGIPREALNIIGALKRLKEDEITAYIKNYKIINEDSKEIKDLINELKNRKSMDDALAILDSVKMEPESIRYAIINYFYRILVKPYGNEKMKKELRETSILLINSFQDTVIHSGKAGLALNIFTYYQ